MQNQKRSVARRLTAKDVENITGKSRMTIWRWVKLGVFPAPYYINGQRSWAESDLIVWQESLPKKNNPTSSNPQPYGTSV
jgi:predicted DNA-binding transcriptional regulator AlpA